MPTQYSEEQVIQLIAELLKNRRSSVYALGLKSHFKEIPAKLIDQAINKMKLDKLITLQKDSGSSLYKVKLIRQEQENTELF